MYVCIRLSGFCAENAAEEDNSRSGNTTAKDGLVAPPPSPPHHRYSDASSRSPHSCRPHFVHFRAKILKSQILEFTIRLTVDIAIYLDRNGKSVQYCPAILGQNGFIGHSEHINISHATTESSIKLASKGKNHGRFFREESSKGMWRLEALRTNWSVPSHVNQQGPQFTGKLTTRYSADVVPLKWLPQLARTGYSWPYLP